MSNDSDARATVDRVRGTVEGVLREHELEWEPGVNDDEYVVTLPGEKKLKTVASLRITAHDLSVSAFVIRHPDENDLEFYTYLLRRNLRLRGLAYSIDKVGDVYVGGRVPHAGVTPEYLDQLFGGLLHAADEPFNELLVIGFITSMRKEWRWRVDHGESTRNLEAFRHLLED